MKVASLSHLLDFLLLLLLLLLALLLLSAMIATARTSCPKRAFPGASSPSPSSPRVISPTTRGTPKASAAPSAVAAASTPASPTADVNPSERTATRRLSDQITETLRARRASASDASSDLRCASSLTSSTDDTDGDVDITSLWTKPCYTAEAVTVTTTGVDGEGQSLQALFEKGQLRRAGGGDSDDAVTPRLSAQQRPDGPAVAPSSARAVATGTRFEPDVRGFAGCSLNRLRGLHSGEVLCMSDSGSGVCDAHVQPAALLSPPVIGGINASRRRSVVDIADQLAASMSTTTSPSRAAGMTVTTTTHVDLGPETPQAQPVNKVTYW